MSQERKSLESIDFKKIIRNQKNKTARKLPNFVINIIRKVMKEKSLNKWLKANNGIFDVDFFIATNRYFNVTIKGKGLEKLDPNGRYIFVANHPLGGFDFSAAAEVLDEKFKHLKVIANKVLSELTNINEMVIPVGVFEKTDIEARKRIETYMSDGKYQVITFPAGLVARKENGKIEDSKWHRSFIRHAKQYERDVVPIYIDSINSKFFYRLGQFRKFLGIKANIELFFIIGEQFKKRNATIHVYIGEPIPHSTFTKEKNQLEWAQVVRNKLCGMLESKV